MNTGLGESCGMLELWCIVLNCDWDILHPLLIGNDGELRTIMAVLVICIVIDGKLSSDEEQLYRRCVEACGFPNRWDAVIDICEKFISGDHIDITDILDIFSRVDVKARDWKYRIKYVCRRVIDKMAC
jgi:hypothetical protein